MGQLTYAQSTDWMTEDYRRLNFPNNNYLTAFVSGEKNQDEELSDAIARIKELAKEEISSNILTTIKSSSELNLVSRVDEGAEKINQSYSTSIKSSSFTKINGIHVDTHVQKGKKRKQLIYAFAYVRKEDLISYYKKDIKKKMSELESFINTADQHIKNLENSKAKEKFLAARRMYNEIDFDYEILMALDGELLSLGISVDDIIKVKEEVEKGLHAIKSGPSFYLQIQSEIFNTKTSVLANKLKAELAESKYSYTRLIANADWLIRINAKARKHNNNYGTYISYVDATVCFEKTFNKEEVYQNTIKQKGVSMNNFKDASELAYEDLAKKIKDLMIEFCTD
ncbi:hypothetical protein GCQ56_00675 [Marinifilum sp. N1E240]|uniref:hypothetical protein n=1 Tax=Marinifilum sp. N1E240 TaxID=2608082 RepID=UPI00128E7A88|nr:hypothetical protein [Marinifilum sp. N1E240]MPQ45506.1 hypothetical protein [Marinifilum sp. N1E240]